VRRRLCSAEPTTLPRWFPPVFVLSLRYGRKRASCLPHLVGAVWSASRSMERHVSARPCRCWRCFDVRARSVEARFLPWWFLCLFFTSAIILLPGTFSWLIPLPVTRYKHWGARLGQRSAFLIRCFPSRLRFGEPAIPNAFACSGGPLPWFGTALRRPRLATADPVENFADKRPESDPF